MNDEEKMYEEFLRNDDKQKNSYTYSKAAKEFKKELLEERLAFECHIQEQKQKEEEHKKDVHFKKWAEGLISDKHLDKEYNIDED